MLEANLSSGGPSGTERGRCQVRPSYLFISDNARPWELAPLTEGQAKFRAGWSRRSGKLQATAARSIKVTCLARARVTESWMVALSGLREVSTLTLQSRKLSLKRGGSLPNPRSHSRLIKFTEQKAVKAISEVGETF